LNYVGGFLHVDGNNETCVEKLAGGCEVLEKAGNVLEIRWSTDQRAFVHCPALRRKDFAIDRAAVGGVVAVASAYLVEQFRRTCKAGGIYTRPGKLPPAGPIGPRRFTPIAQSQPTHRF
jgi:hypothetical protein